MKRKPKPKRVNWKARALDAEASLGQMRATLRDLRKELDAKAAAPTPVLTESRGVSTILTHCDQPVLEDSRGAWCQVCGVAVAM